MTAARAANDRDSRGKAKGDDNRRTGKLSLNEAMDGEGGRQRSMAAMKRKQEKARQKAMGFNARRPKSRCATCSCRKPSLCRNWRTAWPNVPPMWSNR
jgi:hypothetical protein